jgi:hypothetical protein
MPLAELSQHVGLQMTSTLVLFVVTTTSIWIIFRPELSLHCDGFDMIKALLYFTLFTSQSIIHRPELSLQYDGLDMLFTLLIRFFWLQLMWMISCMSFLSHHASDSLALKSPGCDIHQGQVSANGLNSSY